MASVVVKLAYRFFVNCKYELTKRNVLKTHNSTNNSTYLYIGEYEPIASILTAQLIVYRWFDGRLVQYLLVYIECHVYQNVGFFHNEGNYITLSVCV